MVPNHELTEWQLRGFSGVVQALNTVSIELQYSRLEITNAEIIRACGHIASNTASYRSMTKMELAGPVCVCFLVRYSTVQVFDTPQVVNCFKVESDAALLLS